MPYFEDNPLQRLALHSDPPVESLDLRGLTESAAMAQLEALLLLHRASSYLIRFDPAAADGRETLFLPLGRRLLAARRAGQLRRCLPGSDASSYIIEFPAPADHPGAT